MNIEVLVFIYIYICVCVVLFDLMFSFHRWNSERVLPKRISKLETLIRWYNLERNAGVAAPKRLGRRLESKLRRVSYLLVFPDVLERLSEQNPARMRDFIQSTIPLFLRLSLFYRGKSPEIRAYFAYVIQLLQYGTEIPKCTPGERGNIYAIANILLHFESDDSVYVRENAFKALLRIGNPHFVLEAVLRFNETPSHQNEKLLTDNLLEFVGNHRLLAEELWKRLDTFAPMIQVSVVNYLRLLPGGIITPGDYNQALMNCLLSDAYDKEVQLAAIRYFRKYRYDPVQAELTRLLGLTEEHYWEYAAVAASALQNYPCERTVQALSGAVSSSNWYVRFNASESLIGLGVPMETFAGHNQDAYAAEMMAYRSEVKKLKEGKVSWIL